MAEKPKAEQTRPGEAPPTGADQAEVTPSDAPADTTPEEIGGPKGPEPTRYGDWEKNGRCIDF